MADYKDYVRRTPLLEQAPEPDVELHPDAVLDVEPEPQSDVELSPELAGAFVNYRADPPVLGAVEPAPPTPVPAPKHKKPKGSVRAKTNQDYWRRDTKVIQAETGLTYLTVWKAQHDAPLSAQSIACVLGTSGHSFERLFYISAPDHVAISPEPMSPPEPVKPAVWEPTTVFRRDTGEMVSAEMTEPGSITRLLGTDIHYLAPNLEHDQSGIAYLTDKFALTKEEIVSRIKFGSLTYRLAESIRKHRDEELGD